MRHMPVTRGVAVALLALAGTAAAQQVDPRSGPYLAANCANCHGTAGRSAGVMPGLAGQRKEDLVARMKDFRDGKRAATVMHQLAKGYTDAQIELIAAHFAKQPAR